MPVSDFSRTPESRSSSAPETSGVRLKSDTTAVLSFIHHISPARRNGRGLRPFVLKRGKNTVATDTYERERELAAAIVPTVESALPGVEVLAVELLSPARFCVYVDHPDGVDLALCERVTRLLDPYRADWTIDVSSPGPERPLRRPEHFRRAIGGTVRLKTSAAQRYRGTLLGADHEAVTVSVNGTAREIPVGEIVRGNLIDEGRES